MANKDTLRKTGFEPANMLRNGTVASPLRNNNFDVIVNHIRSLGDEEVKEVKEKKDVLTQREKIASRSESSFGDGVGGVRLLELFLKSLPNPKFHTLF